MGPPETNWNEMTPPNVATRTEAAMDPRPNEPITPFDDLAGDLTEDLAGDLAEDLADEAVSTPAPASAPAAAATAPRKKTPATLFEIGVVYRKNSRYYLAVSERTLITFKNGTLQEIRPYARYDVVRSISVEELCQRWSITLDCLDEATARYLAPSAEGVKPRPRGSRRQRAVDEMAWRSLRTIRLLAG
jgi:hypothetical protein